MIGNSFTASLRHNGTAVDAAEFSPIGSSGFSFATLAVEPGTNRLTAAAPFGLYIFGYGSASSYAYIGGIKFDRLNRLGTTSIDTSLHCGILEGIVRDSLFGLGGVPVRIPQATRDNVIVQLGELSRDSSRVAFAAQLRNPYRDGSFVLHIDEEPFASADTIGIPGFTVHAAAGIFSDSTLSAGETFRSVPARRCYSFTLVNYGAYPQEIHALFFRHNLPEYSITNGPALPFALAPGAMQELTLCFAGDMDQTFVDTLLIGDACRSRPIISLNSLVLLDREAPRVDTRSDSCRRTYRVSFSENDRRDWGIATWNIAARENCTIDVDTSTMARSISFVITLDDENRDAYYHIQVGDSAGLLRDTAAYLPGYTLGLVEDAPLFAGFGATNLLATICDSLALYNYGLFPLEIPYLEFRERIHFDVPEHQLPFRIPPGDTVRLLVCFRPQVLGELRDAITLHVACRKRDIPLRGTGVPGIFSALSNCAVEVQLAGQNPEGIFFVEAPFPNPCRDETTVRLGLPAAGELHYTLYNSLGTRVLAGRGVYESGIFDFLFTLPALESGRYYFAFRFGNHHSVQPLLLLR